MRTGARNTPSTRHLRNRMLKTVLSNPLAVIFVTLFIAVLIFAIGRTGFGSTPVATQDFVRVDMHTHTTESDGDRTAEEQIEYAHNLGLKSIWITDHDMIRDLPRVKELLAVAEKQSIALSFGVEITVSWEKKEHHLLGYFPDSMWTTSQYSPQMSTLQRECAAVKESREKRNIELVKFLNSVLSNQTSGQVYFTSEERRAKFEPIQVNNVASWALANANLMEPASLGRPHFRAYLVQVVGVNSNLIFGPRDGDGVAVVTADGKAEFDPAKQEGLQGGIRVEALMHSATLAKRNIAFKPLPIETAIHLITDAGGRAVVAHIPTLGSDWLEDFGGAPLTRLAKAGLWGIEAFSSEISPEQHLEIDRLAKENHLHLTGGSDNHGDLKIYAKLGLLHRNAPGVHNFTELNQWAREGLTTSDSLQQGL